MASARTIEVRPLQRVVQGMTPPSLLLLRSRVERAIEWLEEYAAEHDSPYLVTEAIGELHHVLAEAA